MKLLISCITLYFLSAHFLYSQTNKDESNPYSFSAEIGIGRARFDVKGRVAEEYPTLEVRIGGGVSRKIGNRFQISSGLNFSFRKKTESFLKNSIYFGKGELSIFLDETASKKNHFAFEIPLSIRYLFNGGRSVSTGVMARNWEGTDLSDDILSAQTEFGYILGVNQRIFTDFTVGVDFYWGLTDLLGSEGIVIKNRSVQMSLGYTFKKR